MSRVFFAIIIVSMIYAKLCSGQGSPLCTVNSEPRPCGSLCEPTCRRPQQVICDPIDPSACKRECRCMRGYVRNTITGLCVKPEQCPCRSP